jgi:hypothetical protein
MPRHDLEGDGFSQIVTEAPPIGHNNPPGLLTGEPLMDRVKLTHRDLLKRGADLVAAEARIPKGPDGKLICPDDDWEKKLTETVRQIQGAHGSLDTARTAEIEPYRNATSLVHGLFRDLMDKLVDPDPKKTQNSLKARAERALNDYKTKKRQAEERRLAEEAELRRQEEEKARRAREETERKAREEEDRRRAAAAEEERKAQEAAAEALAVANRKRNAEARAAADAEAARLAEIARETSDRRRREEEQAAEERRQREEAARVEEDQAAEARATAEAAAATGAAGVTRTRSSNAMSGQQEFVDFRDFNRETIDLEKLRAHIPTDAYEQAVRSFVRANADMLKDEIKNRRQPVRGVVFFINTRTQVR